MTVGFAAKLDTATATAFPWLAVYGFVVFSLWSGSSLCIDGSLVIKTELCLWKVVGYNVENLMKGIRPITEDVNQETFGWILNEVNSPIE